MFLRNEDGCYIHESEFTQYIPEFTLKNLKKLNQIKLGNLYAARKMPDTIKCFKKEGEWYKVPGGISGYLTSKFTSLYDSETVEHPALTRASYDYQSSALQDLLTRNVGLLHASTGSGKAQPLYAKILSEAGWITMGDVNVGSRIFTQDGTLTSVTGVYPQGQKEYYRITFSDCTSTTACGDHLWDVQDVNDRRKCTWQTVDTNHIRNNLRAYNGTRNNFSIEFCNPIQFGKKELGINPYLMGLFLGDGYAKGNYLDITTGEEDVVELVKDVIRDDESVSIDKDKRSSAIRIRITGNGKRSHTLQHLDAVGLTGCNSFNKFIPEQYMYSPAGDRLSLLQGLLDSDGSVKNNSGSIEFSSTSIHLVEGLTHIVRSLGGTASGVKERESSYMKNGIRVSCRNHYRVHISFTNGITPVRSEKNMSRYNPKPLKNSKYIVSVELAGYTECQCIMVDHPSHLYITDDFIVTHNTQMICDITTRLKRNTLILVQNLTQMSQMVDDIGVILGVIPTQVSGKKPSKKEQTTWYPHITVCSIDSRDKVNPKDYGLILADEVDTFLGSDDRREWMGNISPEYLYGLTGTIKINHVDDKVFKLYLGPTTTLKLHHLTPNYVQVPTQFSYILEDMKDFHELKEALYTSEERNSIIMDIVINRCKGRKGIVFCEYVEHARSLASALMAKGITTFLLIGEVSKEDRERIRQEAKETTGDVCLIGSVKILGRGFDLPELSYGILSTAEKFESNIQQYIGRIIRAYEGKPHPIFYDLVDQFQYLLSNQSKSRVATFKKEFPTGKVSILNR